MVSGFATRMITLAQYKAGAGVPVARHPVGAFLELTLPTSLDSTNMRWNFHMGDVANTLPPPYYTAIFNN